MSYEEVGIRLRTDGVAEATNGVSLMGQAVAEAGGKATSVLAPALQAVTGAAQGTLGVQDALAVATSGVGIAAISTAAGVGLLVAAYHQGSLETQEFNRAIILTGDYAGVTNGMLAQMAGNIDGIVGTQAQAAEVLAKLVSTGHVTRAQLQESAQAAIQLQRSLGVEVDKTVAAFAALGKDPLKALIKLNETQHFLTMEVYQQVKALEEQGRLAEAAALAQDAYARKGIERAKEMETNLGSLQKGWRFITEAAKEAWDAMLGVGRKKTVEDQLKEVQAQLAAPLRRGVDPTQQQARREALRQQEAELQETLRLQQRQADMQSTAAKQVEQAIAADQKKDKGGREKADPYRALNEEITRTLILTAAELQNGDKLTEAERRRLEIIQKADAIERAGGSSQAAGLVRQRADAVAFLVQQMERQRAEEKEADDRLRQFTADRAQATEQAYRELAALEQRRDRLAEETAEIGLSTQALAERKQALIDAEIAAKQAHIQRIEGLPAYAEETAALQRQLQVLREIRSGVAANASAKQAQAELDDQKRRAKHIEDSIYDGIVNGFREGRRPADIFLREFQAQAARTLLRIPVQLISNAASDIGGSLSSLFKFLGGSGGGGGGGGGFPDLIPSTPPIPGLPVLAATGGGRALSAGRSTASSIVFSPTIAIDARTDRAEVHALVMKASRAAMAEFVDNLDR